MREILMFTSPTCRPCQIMKPYMNGVTIIDLADGRTPFDERGIKSTPTLVFLKDGQELKRFSGYLSEEQYKSLVREVFTSELNKPDVRL